MQRNCVAGRAHYATACGLHLAHPVVTHLERVVHEIARRGEHLIEQRLRARLQPICHRLVCSLQLQTHRLEPLARGVARQRVGIGADRGVGVRDKPVAMRLHIFDVLFDLAVRVIVMRVGHHREYAVRPVQRVRRRIFAVGVAQIGRRIGHIRVERRGRGERAGTV